MKFLAPPLEQSQALLSVARLIAQVIRPAAERIDVIEVLMQALGEKKADYLEILVVVRGQPARIGKRFVQGPDA